ncbi:aspartyl-tRNA synthetase [Paenibacillus sp. JCM 10914]|nr:aspartyl-tRNA synthetase [Paenibacillus sp. JCM 10914]
MKRTHHCGHLTTAHIGETVTLNGWVQTRRDLGGVLFIDLRDRSGIMQIVFNPDFSGEALALADKVRSEYVVAVTGKVVKRDPETFNPNLPTGEIEVQVTSIEVLNAAKTPPFFIEDGVEVDEQLRLKHRYLDLRRPEMQKTLMLRSKASKIFRDFLDDEALSM